MTSKAAFPWRKIFQYFISLAAAMALLYWAFHDISFFQLWDNLAQVHWGYLLLSLGLGLASHVVRAHRWAILLHPLGHRPGLLPTFVAVMIAYLANLAVPRLGEVARCAFLQRKRGIPLAIGFGTVVTERITDLLALLVLIGLMLIFEFNTLYTFFAEQFFPNPEGSLSPSTLLIGIVLMGILVLASVIYWLRWRGGWAWIQTRPLYQRLAPTLRSFSDGLLSIRKLQRPWLFWWDTLLIWLLYFGMAYTVVLAFPPTAHLPWISGITILVVGGMGMAAPVQGGVGAYHLLVSNLLLIYGVSSLDGITFATLMHTSQTLLVLVIGGLALFTGLFIRRHVNPTHPTEDSIPDPGASPS